MKYAVKLLVGGIAIAATGLAPAMAADIYEQPMVIEAPAYAAPEYVPAAVTGWYLRGDIGYAINNFGGAEYYTFSCPGVGCPGGIVAGSNTLSGDLKGSFGYGVGAGYQMNHYLRGDVTLDNFETDFTGRTRGACGVALDCISTDIASATALALMANVYVDFGTYGRFTPYAGVGIGGVQLNWGDLLRTPRFATRPSVTTAMSTGASHMRSWPVSRSM